MYGTHQNTEDLRSLNSPMQVLRFSFLSFQFYVLDNCVIYVKVSEIVNNCN